MSAKTNQNEKTSRDETSFKKDLERQLRAQLAAVTGGLAPEDLHHGRHGRHRDSLVLAPVRGHHARRYIQTDDFRRLACRDRYEPEFNVFMSQSRSSQEPPR